jgi:chitodextrinase
VAVAGYKVYRNGTQIATPTSNSYQDSGLSPSTSYTYTVSAYDTSGNNSNQSSSVSASTLAPDTTPPSVPSNLTASAISPSQINLTWSASTDNVAVAGYKVYRNGTQIATPTSNSYQDSGLTAGATYTYSVSAYDTSGNNSNQSSSVSATTLADTIPPSAISNLSVSSCTANSCTLSWTAPGNDGNIGTATSYDIRCSTASITDANWSSATQTTGEPAPQIAGTAQSMTISGLTSATTYYFAIKTSDTVPNVSALSNVASHATTSGFDYYVVTGANQWKPTTAQSYPPLLGSYTDAYGLTVRRMTNEPGDVKPNYPARTSTIESSDGTMFAVYSAARGGSTGWDIFTVDGTYRGNLAAFSNNAGDIAYDDFIWSSTVPNVGYLFAQSRPSLGLYDKYPAKFWKITVNTSTWAITGQLLYTYSRADMPTCPSGETLYTVRNHDEGPPSWDGRYWLSLFKCSGDNTENSAYAILLLDRDLNGFEKTGIKGYVILPPRAVYNAGISPGGGYFFWREYGTATCGFDGSCVKFFPISSINGNTDYNGYTLLGNGTVAQAIGGHYALGYDDLGNEVYVTLVGTGTHSYDIGYYRFNLPGHPVDVIPWSWWKSSQFGPGHIDVHPLTGGPGARSWFAIVDTSSDPADECGYEGTEGTATITYVHLSATNPKVFRVAHERNESINYDTESFAGASRDGTKFYFSSNWCGTQSQQLFRVELPATWSQDLLNANAPINNTPPAAPTGLSVI